MELDLGSADPAQEQEQAMETGPENGLGETEAPPAAQSAPLDLGKRPERTINSRAKDLQTGSS